MLARVLRIARVSRIARVLRITRVLRMFAKLVTSRRNDRGKQADAWFMLELSLLAGTPVSLTSAGKQFVLTYGGEHTVSIAKMHQIGPVLRLATFKHGQIPLHSPEVIATQTLLAAPEKRRARVLALLAKYIWRFGRVELGYAAPLYSMTSGREGSKVTGEGSSLSQAFAGFLYECMQKGIV